MLNDQDLRRMTVVCEPVSGTVWAIDPDKDVPTLVVQTAIVHPDFRNLIAAAHLLYRVNAETLDGLQMLVDVLEAHGADALVPSIMQFAASMRTAQRCAIEGLDLIAKSQK